MKTTLKSILVAVVAVMAFITTLHAGTVRSTFDTDRENWTVADLVQPFNGLPVVAHVHTPSWTAGGGNPGGCIQQADIPFENAWFFSAPSAFLGNKSTYLSGTLSWDLACDHSATDTNTFEQLILTDGITALYYYDNGPGLANTWRTYSALLVGSSFRVGSREGPVATDNELSAVLSNLTALYILGDWAQGDEVSRLDNVSLTETCPAASIRVSQVEICWPSESNAVYQVEYRSDLTTNTWVALFTNVIAAGEETCVTDAVARGTPQRFYRVVCPTP